MQKNGDTHNLHIENDPGQSTCMVNVKPNNAPKKMTMILKRIYDVIFSAIGLIALSPFFAVIAILIKADSPGPIFFKQTRVGKNGAFFNIYKFRKMYMDAGDKGLKITTSNDARITDFGKILRKYKLDEFPQLWNVLKGDMSIVGPRPETPNYVEYYSEEQRKILELRPGITDYASVEFINEGDLLEKCDDPNKYYIETLIPLKIQRNMDYMQDISIRTDIRIILLTLGKIIRGAGD